MTNDMLLKISLLASEDPFYLGWHLVRYSEMRKMKLTEVGRELGCLPEMLNSISLCRAPRLEPPHFRSDIERVADRFQVRADSLMRIVRYVQVESGESMLLAARERSTRDDSEAEHDEHDE
jgi:hypothetical protein